ncbi:MAG: AI-2E family transporter, partial [Pseudomonadota bacterium]
IRQTPVIGKYLPGSVSFVLSFIVITFTIIFLALIVRENIGAVLEKAPEYRQRLQDLATNMVTWAETIPFIPQDFLSALAEIIEGVGSGIMMETEDPAATNLDTAATHENLTRQAFSFAQGIVGNFTAAVGGLLGSLIATFLYTVFLLIERGRFIKKIGLMVNEQNRDGFAQEILDDIGVLVRTYISVKTLISFSVAMISFLIMTALGTDFAGFWALIIFAFGFIPIVGAVIAIALPTLLTLIQPDGGLAKAALTLVLLTAAEQTISSFVEPRLMGRSLNLSPLVILLSLATWGTLWGFPGMLLCVPITVTFLIILSQFEATRPIAILLSDNGEIAPLKRGKTKAEPTPAPTSP